MCPPVSRFRQSEQQCAPAAVFVGDDLGAARDCARRGTTAISRRPAALALKTGAKSWAASPGLGHTSTRVQATDGLTSHVPGAVTSVDPLNASSVTKFWFTLCHEPTQALGSPLTKIQFWRQRSFENHTV